MKIHFLNYEKPNSIGKILSNFKYKIFINKEISTKNKMIGELRCKGKTLLKNYFKNKSLYKKCFKNGYFLTGDYVLKDKNDEFFILIVKRFNH